MRFEMNVCAIQSHHILSVGLILLDYILIKVLLKIFLNCLLCSLQVLFVESLQQQLVARLFAHLLDLDVL